MSRRQPCALLVLFVVTIGTLTLAASPAQAQQRIFTYTISSQGAVQGDLGGFAAVAADALADARGWSLGGEIDFQQVASGSDFDLILASPSVVGNAAPGCSPQWSCRVGRNVYINDDRWRGATASWTYGLDLYRRYVILHEVGHWLGLGHTDCPAAGRTAWVMQQQSISLQGCRANVWPVIQERRDVGRIHGVSVNWSPVEGEYMRLGMERGVLGAPVSWERGAIGGGQYQSFARGTIHFSSASGAHETHGDIDTRYRRTGGSGGSLGYPVSGTRVAADQQGRYSRFQGGTIHWAPGIGAHETHGDIDARYRSTGGSGGPLAYPTTSTRATADGVGRYNRFSGTGGGIIFWSPGNGAHEVYGPILDRYGEESYERGPLGYPVRGVHDVPGGQRVDFEGGYIRWDRATGQTTVG